MLYIKKTQGQTFHPPRRPLYYSEKTNAIVRPGKKKKTGPHSKPGLGNIFTEFATAKYDIPVRYSPEKQKSSPISVDPRAQIELMWKLL
jgi:hypothetical protein